MVQAYSALPFNITSGVTTVQGTPGRPLVGGEYIARNSGKGPSFFSVSARLSRTIPLRGSTRLEALVEAFNLTNHTNVITVNGTFGTGAYPASPAPGFGAATSVGDPRTIQLGLRLRF